MSIEAVKQEIEAELHTLVNAGHEFGVQKVADLLHRMWAYFHTTVATPATNTAAEIALKASTAATEIADYAHQRVDALEKHVVESVGSRLADLNEKVEAIHTALTSPEGTLADMGATAKADAAKAEAVVAEAVTAVQTAAVNAVAAVLPAVPA